MYEYNAKLLRVVDGDTVWLRVDLGFRTWVESSFRLFGVNAPEVRGDNRDAGLAAASFLHDKLMGKSLRITSKGLDKYGRWLAVIFVEGSYSVNHMLVEAGHAVPYMEG